jgi:non-ribosomal peptide synthetase component F
MIVKKFKEIVKGHKNNIAVKTGEKTLTYGQLWDLSNRLAQAIAAAGPGGPGQTTGLLLDHGIEQVVGLSGQYLCSPG